MNTFRELLNEAPKTIVTDLGYEFKIDITKIKSGLKDKYILSDDVDHEDLKYYPSYDLFILPTKDSDIDPYDSEAFARIEIVDGGDVFTFLPSARSLDRKTFPTEKELNKYLKSNFEKFQEIWYN